MEPPALKDYLFAQQKKLRAGASRAEVHTAVGSRWHLLRGLMRDLSLSQFVRSNWGLPASSRRYPSWRHGRLAQPFPRPLQQTEDYLFRQRIGAAQAVGMQVDEGAA